MIDGPNETNPDPMDLFRRVDRVEQQLNRVSEQLNKVIQLLADNVSYNQARQQKIWEHEQDLQMMTSPMCEATLVPYFMPVTMEVPSDTDV